MPTALTFSPFAPGATVSAYERRDERPTNTPGPAGRQALGTAVVDATGTVTFDLPVGRYWATGLVGSEWRWVAFSVQAPLDPARTDPEVHQFLYDVATAGTSSPGTGGGVALEDIPDASTSVKGLTRLTSSPADAAQPIAVGATDSRLSPDQAGSASIRTIGTGANQAAAGDHTHPELPSTTQKDALAGTNGSPSTTNRFVTDSDARNTNARAPTAHTHSVADTTGLQAALDAKQDERLTIEDRATTGAYTLVAADAEKVKRYTGATAAVWTVPASVFSAGDWIEFHQTTTGGEITFAAGAGLTLNSRDNWLKTAGQHAVVRLLFITAAIATLAGDLKV